ncbi:PadR family transcriptional regulator [Aminipila luticellarii]|uniref:PadR family transcriptional regulator n=1 Tax=Aminipila luticellarii TaxID=2507160 RepID=A0A410PTJ6_9FIRM|nr:PadR family transcriptional regulator [Aminipila luticellarii]QAT42255.1 PadR family transcriptional regulator [Aminipila luticellarii]
MIPSQMLKGVLEGCVLKVVSGQETYGYQIVQELKNYGFTEIVEGTIYPLLLRLDNKGMLKSRLVDSDIGPKRKYYSITLLGTEVLKEFRNNWKELDAVVNALFRGEE